MKPILIKYLKKRTFKPIDALIEIGDKVIYTPDYFYAKHKDREGVILSLSWHYKNRFQQFGTIKFENPFNTKEFSHGEEVKIYEDKWYKVVGYEEISRKGLIGFLTKGEIKETLEEVNPIDIPDGAYVEYREEQL